MDKNLETIKKFVEGNFSAAELLDSYHSNQKLKGVIDKYNDPALERKKSNMVQFMSSVNLKSPVDLWELQYCLIGILAKNRIRFKATDVYTDACQEYYSVIPNWLPDSASDWVEENILNKVPEGMNKTERKKWIKEQVELAYPCVKRHPSWVQATSDWPKDKDGNNLTFVKQKEDGEEVTYTFIDPKTNEEVEVVEFY